MSVEEPIWCEDYSRGGTYSCNIFMRGFLLIQNWYQQPALSKCLLNTLLLIILTAPWRPPGKTIISLRLVSFPRKWESAIYISSMVIKWCYQFDPSWHNAFQWLIFSHFWNINFYVCPSQSIYDSDSLELFWSVSHCHNNFRMKWFSRGSECADLISKQVSSYKLFQHFIK